MVRFYNKQQSQATICYSRMAVSTATEQEQQQSKNIENNYVTVTKDTPDRNAVFRSRSWSFFPYFHRKRPTSSSKITAKVDLERPLLESRASSLETKSTEDCSSDDASSCMQNEVAKSAIETRTIPTDTLPTSKQELRQRPTEILINNDRDGSGGSSRSILLKQRVYGNNTSTLSLEQRPRSGNRVRFKNDENYDSDRQEATQTIPQTVSDQLRKARELLEKARNLQNKY